MKQSLTLAAGFTIDVAIFAIAMAMLQLGAYRHVKFDAVFWACALVAAVAWNVARPLIADARRARLP